MNNKNERALITGASSGIGLALAREFARQGHPLVITARQQEELQILAAELQQEFSVEVTPVAKDLTEASATQEIFDELKRGGMNVHILVNNAGIGEKGKFVETPLDRDVATIRLNAEAVVQLTKLFLKPMVARNSGRILNVASVAGFEPGPMLAVYHASKAFVLSFSQALSTELEDTAITVTALCPGATETNFFENAHMTDTRIFQKLSLAQPHDVAVSAYKAMRRGTRVYVHGGLNKAMVAARRVLSVPAQAKLNQKFYEDVRPEEQKRKPRRASTNRIGDTTLRSQSRFHDAEVKPELPRSARRHAKKARVDDDQFGENS